MMPPGKVFIVIFVTIPCITIKAHNSDSKLILSKLRQQMGTYKIVPPSSQPEEKFSVALTIDHYHLAIWLDELKGENIIDREAVLVCMPRVSFNPKG